MEGTERYYRIRLDPPLRKLEPHTHLFKNFSWTYAGSNPYMCEINFLQEGSLCRVDEAAERIYDQGTVFVLVNDRPCRVRSQGPRYHEFFLQFLTSSIPEAVSEEDVALWGISGNEAILPENVTDPAVCQQLAAQMKYAVGLPDSSDGWELKLRSCLYDCLFLLTRHAMERARERQKFISVSRSRYTDLACAWIHEHLREPIRVEDVAAAVGISYSHLKVLFCRDMKMNLVEYITRARIRLVEEYITVQGMTLEKAGIAVGLPDTKYLSKLFRRCTGVTVREYRRIYSEQAELYSQLPDE